MKQFALQILDKEVVYNWDLFFEQFVNSDNKDEMIVNLAGMIVKVTGFIRIDKVVFGFVVTLSLSHSCSLHVDIDVLQAYNYVQNPPKNSPINQLPIVLNGVLLTYKLPAYDSSKPAKSLSALLNKAIKVFSTYKVDTTPIVNQLAVVYSEVSLGNVLSLF